MAGIGIQEVKTVEITTTDGQMIKEGDAIVICVKGQDIVCRFAGMDKGGYIVTLPTVSGAEAIKYRPASIEKCYKVKAFEWEDLKTQQDAGAPAADYADQDTLAPAAV